MTETTRHDRIFLQLWAGEDATWSTKRLHEDDVEYIRADIVEADIARLKEELENEQARGIHSCGPNCKMSGCVNRKLHQQLSAKDVVLRQARDALLGTNELLGYAINALGPNGLTIFNYSGPNVTAKDAIAAIDKELGK